MSTKPELNSSIFRAYDIRGIVGEDLTPATAEIIGQASGTFLQQLWGKRIAVGMDNRPSSDSLKAALIAGLRSTGCDTVDIGLATSPVLYHAVVEGGFHGGINVTASHNPAEYNGFKVVGEGAYPVAADDMFRLRDIALAGHFARGSGSLGYHDPAPGYLAAIRRGVRLSRSVKLVLDTGNGVAGMFGPQALRSLGCQVDELYCELDGTFPNHVPNPENEANVADLKRRVLETGAEIGLAVDGDGDRLGVIDEHGVYRESDYVIIFLARDFLQRHPGATVLVDVKSSLNVLDDIGRHGGVPLLYKTGHSLIKQKMRADNLMLGGELSGHLYVFEGYYPYDDALFAAARVLEVLSRSDMPFSMHFEALPKLAATRMIEVPCADSRKFSVMREVVRAFAADYPVNDIDGARIDFGEGWAVIRASNTTPILTFRAEARTPQKLAEILHIVHGVLKRFPEIQADALWEKH